MALTVKAAELQEILQWLAEDETYNITSAQRDALADIMIYLARFAAIAGIDIEAAGAQKLVKNAREYPTTR